ncbi:MAG: hypothetical protein WDW36_009844 [Sanguina aurantia]
MPRTDPAGTPPRDGVSARLWMETKLLAYESLLSPFVLGLAQGTLPRSTFQHYVGQDAFFLTHFASAYTQALAVAQSTGCSVAVVQGLHTLLTGCNTELAMHVSYAGTWGVDLAACTPSPATLAYTDFLDDVGRGAKTVDVILAAMVPCSRLYGFIGCQLAAAYPLRAEHLTGGPSPAPHEYCIWIQTYSSAAYLALPDLKERLLDEVAVSDDYGRWSLVAADFDETCSQKDTIGGLMARAVLVASQREATPEAQTASLEASQALQARLSANYVTELKKLLVDALPPLPEASAISEPLPFNSAGVVAFLRKLSTFDIRMNQVVVESGVLAGMTSADQTEVGRAVPLRPYALETLRAMSSSGVPVAIMTVNWSQELVTAALSPPPSSSAPSTPTLTANDSAPAGAGDSSSPSDESSHSLDSSSSRAAAAAAGPGGLQIFANSLELTGAHGQQQHQQQQRQPGGHGCATTTGRIQPVLQCAADKGQLFARLWQRHSGTSRLPVTASAQQQHPSGAGVAARGQHGAGAVAYVGDSTSDLLPLLMADYGILIGTNSQVRKVCATFGVQLKPLCSAPLLPPPAPELTAQLTAILGGRAGGDAASGATAGLPEYGSQSLDDAALAGFLSQQGGVLYTASGWDEIQAFMFNGAAPGSEGAQAVTPPADSQSSAAAAGTDAPGAAGGGGGAKAAAPAAAAVAAVRCPPMPRVPRVLTIAGSDSGGGAGIQADLKAFISLGTFGCSAITALTAQNTHGVHGVEAASLDMLAQQIDAVLSDIGADAVKTGMLPTAAAVALVAAKMKEYKVANLVVDPVMISTSGHSLAGSEVGAALMAHLLPLAVLVTPNIPEASALLGGMAILTVADMEAAGRALQRSTGCRAVLVKGGHMLEVQQRAALASASATAVTDELQQRAALASASAAAVTAGELPPVVSDVLVDGEATYVLTAPRVETDNTHGTGCTLAASIAAGLSKGLPLHEAVGRARAYLHAALRVSAPLQIGSGVQRPFNHGWAVADWRARPACDLRVYAVTDEDCNAKCGRSLVDAVTAAVAGGATIVQLREKRAGGGEFFASAAAALAVCRAAGVALLINDRVDVALAVGADGVHVGQGDIPAAAVRRMIGPWMLLGVSAKTEAEAAQAAKDGADYIGVGAVMPTNTKDTGVIGLAGLSGVCAASPIPVVAIGGISAANAAACVAAGAHGVAVVSAVFAAADPAAAAAQLRSIVDGQLALTPRL